MNPIVSDQKTMVPEPPDRQAQAAEPRIRAMKRTDLEEVGALLFRAFHQGAVKHGYAPRIGSKEEGLAWAWALFRYGSPEILVAHVDDRLAGVCGLYRRGAHGGIGPVAVDPAWQGRGVGSRLMAALLERAAGLESVRLFQEAFNPASFSLYYGLGFEPVSELLDLTAEPREGRGAAGGGGVSELAGHELTDAAAYDMARSRYDRREDLAYYMKWGKVLVCRRASEIRGVLACVPGGRSVHLGPLVADGEEEARSLYERACAVYNGRQVGTRVMARDRLLVSALRQMGFRIYCLNMLMVRGTWRPGSSVEAFGRFPEGT